MTDSLTTPDAWPAASTLVDLIWALTEAQGRVTQASEDLLALALAQARVRLPDIGARMDLRWGDLAGLHERPVTLHSTRGGLVHVGADGPAASVQRRRFYRAAVAIDLTLQAGSYRLPGRTVDLSEGGTRVAVATRAAIPTASLTTRLQLDPDPVDVPARVVRSVPDGSQTQLGLAFGHLPEAAADRIRHRVLAAQIVRRTGDLR